MQALINAGGKGTRMGRCGIEKPMQMIGDKPTVQRVLDALQASKNIDKVFVSVSDHTLCTEEYLKGMGVETIRTSGESFMDDLHASFKRMEGDFVLTCPSDLPLLTTDVVDRFIEYFNPRVMDSAIAVVDERTVRGIGITPSYTREERGNSWVLSGLCIMNRQKTLAGDYLEEYLFDTNWPELAVNVNTPRELDLARSFFRERSSRPLCRGRSPPPSSRGPQRLSSLRSWRRLRRTSLRSRLLPL